MAARTPRRSFAAPFVVTLAAVPACYVQTSPGPSGPPPSQPPPTQTAEPAQPTPPPPGPVVANPPRPTQPPPSQPSTPPPYRPDPRPTQPPPTQTSTPPPPVQQAQESRWSLFKSNDGSGCMAAIKVECQPKATCNPPPPFKVACPDGISLDKPVTVVTQDGGASCFVEFEMPKCPPGTACNPPRPRPVACPKR